MWIRLIPYAAAALFAAYVSWYVTSNSYDDDIADLNAQHAAALSETQKAQIAECTKAQSITEKIDHETQNAKAVELPSASIATKANSTHTHSASDLTSGTFADARVAQSNVTQHQAALSIASTQVTGTKTSAYISDFNAAVDARQVAQKSVVLGSVKNNSFIVAMSATVASGNAVFHLTNNNASGGAAVCPNGNVYLDSLMVRAVEGTMPHTPGAPTLSNSNKTITLPITKVATVLGLLSLNQSADGSVIKATVLCD